MTSRKKSPRPPAPVDPLGAVVRQRLLHINGLLDEVTRNYLARLHREVAALIRLLEKNESEAPGLSDRKRKELRALLKLCVHLQIDPERGRRKDLKKIDALIGEFQSVLERW